MFKAKQFEYLVVEVLKPLTFPLEWKITIKYYNRKTKKVRIPNKCVVFDSYVSLYTALKEAGLMYAGRSEDDDPSILEIWI